MNQREKQILLGLTADHLCDEGEFAGVLHKEVVAPFMDLVVKAKVSGFDLRIISGYRSFQRQLAIWNGKACGDRPVVDDQDCQVPLQALTELEKIEAIMRFSALPGTSRHHWGTDFDLYDAAAMPKDYQIQLSVSETQVGGPFAEIHRWLDEQLPILGFYRPYQTDTGGVSIEPWHLSYQPIADAYAKKISSNLLIDAYREVEIELFDGIEGNIEALVERFVRRS